MTITKKNNRELRNGNQKFVAENWELIDDKKMTRKKQKATLEITDASLDQNLMGVKKYVCTKS